jgi:hypothetical protein
MDQRTTIYLVRHAESQPSGDVPEAAWPLSPRGLEQAQALVPVMRELGIIAIYASPYVRALHTVDRLFADTQPRRTAIAADRRTTLRSAPDAGLSAGRGTLRSGARSMCAVASSLIRWRRDGARARTRLAWLDPRWRAAK